MRESRFWTWHLTSAVIILVFLGLHMVIMHLDGTLALIEPAWGGPLAWDKVVARGQSAFFTTSYLVLLGAALFHGLYGLRTMVFELSDSRALRKSITVALAAGGLLLFALGSYAVITMHVSGAGV